MATRRQTPMASSSGLDNSRSDRRANVERAIERARETRGKSWEALFPSTTSRRAASSPKQERKRGC